MGILYLVENPPPKVTFQKAKQQLEIIKQYELEQIGDTEYELIDDDLSFDLIKEGGDFTTSFKITEMEVI